MEDMELMNDSCLLHLQIETSNIKEYKETKENGKRKSEHEWRIRARTK